MPDRLLQRKIAGTLVGVLSGLVVVGLLYLIVQTYGVVELIREDQGTNARTFERIESCTTPGEECFEDSQERTGEVIDNINLVAIVAAACADQSATQTVREIRECVVEELGRIDR